MPKKRQKSTPKGRGGSKRRRQVSATAIETALRHVAGNVTLAARELGVTRDAMYKRMKAQPELVAIVAECRDELVDHAESSLRRAVLRGNIRAVQFTLKTIGKDRGYVERREVTGADGAPVLDVNQIAEAAQANRARRLAKKQAEAAAAAGEA